MRVRVPPSAPERLCVMQGLFILSYMLYDISYMNETLFLSLSNSDDISTIDLHNSPSIDESLVQFEKELFSFSKNKEKYVKIIYGIGGGVLKKEIVELIKKHPLVKIYCIGENGFCIV